MNSLQNTAGNTKNLINIIDYLPFKRKLNPRSR